MTKIYTLAALLLSFTGSWGQAGSLNPYFNGGTVNTAFDPFGALAEDLVVQSDGKIIAAGLAFDGGIAHFAIARYNTNGTLDASFGSAGRVTTLINTGSWARAIALQSDGKFIVAGLAEDGTSQDFALARYHADGSLDISFGTGGIVTTDFTNSPDEIYDLAIQADGKIIAGGRTYNGINYDFALARYLADGSLDVSFSGGKVVSGVGPGNDFAQSVQVQPDGKIVLAGTAFNGINNNMALVRFTNQGLHDVTFGSGGKVITAVGTTESFGFDIALQPDGKIVFTGHTSNILPYRIDVAVVRYTTAGLLDHSFGINGMVVTDVANTNDDGIGVAVQSDGKIIVGGHTTSDGFTDFLLLRYLSNGALDSDFGAGGMTTIPVGNYDDIAYSVKLSGLNIYIAGVSNSSPGGVPGEFAIAALLNDAAPLPVRLLAFTAEKEGGSVLLQWKTENEYQLDGFIVERSGDGRNFEKIIQVAAAGNTTGSKNYYTKDPRPLPVINYYRLKQLDLDGSFTYSRTIALRNKDNRELEVFPNPATSLVQVQLPSGLSGRVALEVIEYSGRVVLKNMIELTGNATSTSIDLTQLPKGVYLLKATSTANSLTQKIVKQ